jgi:hypothetical protein
MILFLVISSKNIFDEARLIEFLLKGKTFTFNPFWFIKKMFFNIIGKITTPIENF